MSRRLSRPYFPVPPQQYQQRYFSEVIRAFSVFLEQVQNPGDIRATELTLTDLQTDDSGLETGALFQQDGFVKIALINKPHVRGSAGTGGVGTVTVTTT
jgi:hypothetical protein